MNLITCTQCKRTMPEDNFRPLRGTRKHSRGRQKLCKDCERLNNAFKRVHEKHLQDPHNDDVLQEHEQYLEWYRAIIARDGGPYKARIPNIAREALGYQPKDTRRGSQSQEVCPIDIASITKITRMQIAEGTHGEPVDETQTSVTISPVQGATVMPDVTTDEIATQLNELQDVMSVALEATPEDFRTDVQTLCLIVEGMLRACVDEKPLEEIYSTSSIGTLESIASYLDVNDEVIIDADLISCLDSSLGVLIDLIKGHGDAKATEVLEYLQAVLFEM